MTRIKISDIRVHSRVDPFGAFRLVRRLNPLEKLARRLRFMHNETAADQIHIEQLEIFVRGGKQSGKAVFVAVEPLSLRI